MRVLVCTVVHHPTDARIFRREIGALLAAGHSVTAIAPWQPDTPGDERVRRVPVPRAVGRDRLPALRAARGRVRDLTANHDLLLLHDPELLLAVPWGELRRTHTPVVWDVHEDLAAAVLTKTYIPTALRRLVASAVRLLERWAERRCHLLLAERGYADRFRRNHPIVLNLPLVPAKLPAGERRRQVIYVGSITEARGLSLMLDLAALLAPHGIGLRLIGEVHSEVDTTRIRAAANVDWAGPLPNAEALAEVEQSLFGLSLLADLPNYRHSMPTKILEYLASGTVVVSTPLPLAVEVLGADGVLLPGFDADSLGFAVEQIVALAADPDRRVKLARAGHARVAADYNWQVAGGEFAAELAAIAASAR